eukprot:COSAG03_NODE_4595_length_1496_cov_2.161059_1_plen_136_part_00
MGITQFYIRRRRREKIGTSLVVVSGARYAGGRRARRARARMDWELRVSSLTDHEFISRYRVDLTGFDAIVEKITPRRSWIARGSLHLAASSRPCLFPAVISVCDQDMTGGMTGEGRKTLSWRGVLKTHGCVLGGL